MCARQVTPAPETETPTTGDGGDAAPAPPPVPVPAPAQGVVPPPPKPGPFGLGASEDPFSFYYFIRPGQSPTDVQFALALRISSLIGQIGRFKSVKDPEQNALAHRLANDLRDVFSAGLAQEVTVEIDHFVKEVDAREEEFMSRILTPAHRGRISGPAWATFFCMLLALLVATTADAIDAKLLTFYAFPLLDTFAFVVSGALLGRLLFLVMTHQTRLTSIGQYDDDGARIGRGGFVIFLDAVIGVIACLAFVNGFIVIAIGIETPATGAADAGSGLSTLAIKESPLIAFFFGVIVGVARTEFIARFSGMARQQFST